ncbi:uncharacterized protein LOC132601735 [Lycium barbarum]|uniref:uncharacterized protein LOC132601735 n=1 Tax=Lycium barbarum TaxID=112863 RepID=UPI00293F1F3F|nr:uncharacterized protein LOC132601735 [Lycium barbarum]
MTSENFMQTAIPRFDGHYNHWSMFMENFPRSKDYWQVVMDGIPESAEGTTVSKHRQQYLSKLRGEESNFDEQEEEEISLLMVCYMMKETSKNLWYLNSGCSNHMSRDKSVFSTLDESFRDSVKFGNNTKFSVMGKGQVVIQTNRDFTHTIADVLFVPDLRTNHLSFGQLQEKGYEISIKDGVFRIFYTNLD